MSTRPTSPVAANVRAEIARRGLRHADLAAALGISAPAMSRRLNGEMTFDVDELQTVADFLGVDFTELMARTPEPAAQAAGP
jgi:transcriptional regulator with XRE-family HTH domain